jgi:hypothetical protein
MRNDCLDIGIIQAFMDCELTHEESARVSAHIALCDACAISLAEAEEESAMVFPVLEREMDTLVPTQRLWSRINDSIILEKDQMPWWQKVWAALGANFVNPSMAIVASLILVAGISVIVLMNRGTVSQSDISQVAPTTPSNAPRATTSTPSDTFVAPVSKSTEPAAVMPRPERAAYRPEPQRLEQVQAASRTSDPAYLPGEESYVKTITTLAKNVDGKKDSVLAASERVAFERDMALVNDSITKLRKEVKRNPRNDSAKQILYTSYQNKIDLLNSVAQKEEMIASLVD